MRGPADHQPQAWTAPRCLERVRRLPLLGVRPRRLRFRQQRLCHRTVLLFKRGSQLSKKIQLKLPRHSLSDVLAELAAPHALLYGLGELFGHRDADFARSTESPQVARATKRCPSDPKLPS